MVSGDVDGFVRRRALDAQVHVNRLAGAGRNDIGMHLDNVAVPGIDVRQDMLRMVQECRPGVSCIEWDENCPEGVGRRRLGRLRGEVTLHNEL